ncbi:T9SS type A sorting domain-containing protein [Bernardetia litoralis]|uniref:T9SS type A sorting domain-containing protein n=1 Tax=Bernardetia litoralis TaxID=999 RepID=UPI0002DFB2A6|nr:T9SS type A sorting domain-containing protein [Bernardetia litoralis]
MNNLSFYYCQNKPFLFGKGLFLGGFDYIEPPYDCNGNDAGMGKIAVKDKEEINSKILLFPNPTNTEFSLKSSLKIQEVSISNSLGQILVTTKESQAISITSFSKGVYIVRVTLENGEVQTKKLIIN